MRCKVHLEQNSFIVVTICGYYFMAYISLCCSMLNVVHNAGIYKYQLVIVLCSILYNRSQVPVANISYKLYQWPHVYVTGHQLRFFVSDTYVPSSYNLHLESFIVSGSLCILGTLFNIVIQQLVYHCCYSFPDIVSFFIVRYSLGIAQLLIILPCGQQL